MKKILSIFLILIICGSCSRFLNEQEKFIKLGYDESSAEKIINLSLENKKIFLEYSDNKNNLINNDNFNESNLNDYLKYDLPADSIIYLVNNNIINDENYNQIKKLINDDYYIVANTNIYLKYVNEINDTRSLIEYVNTNAYKTPYEDAVKSDTSKNILMIANKYYSLDTYKPDDLVEVESDYCLQGNNYLRKEAYEAYKQMADAARSENIYFYISTSYRSYDYQSYFYNRYLDQYKDQTIVDTFSARPGYSDHQTGLVVDIRKHNYTFDSMYDSEEINWLLNNSYKYGFILRYPQGKETATGYEYEWWHYRYVSKEVATYIYEHNITFDEYYEYFVK